MPNEIDINAYNVIVDEDFTAEWPEKKDILIDLQKYKEEDMKTCASKIFKKYVYDYTQKFFMVSSETTIDDGLKQVKSILTPKNNIIFCIFAIKKSNWVFSCFVYQSDGLVTFLYKDPSGGNVPNAISEIISQIFPKSTIIVNHKDNIGRNSDVYYGPLCLRNLIILLAVYKEQSENEKVITDLFPRIVFSTVEKINQDRMGIALKIAEEVSKNSEFMEFMTNYMDNLPPYEDAAKEVSTFQKDILDIYSELEKEENKASPDKAKIQKNLEKIKNLRESLFESKVMKKFASSVKDYKEDKNNNTKIETKYPEEVKKIKDMFKIIQTFEYNEESKSYLNSICAVLEISKKHMELFCKSKNNKKPDKSKNPEAPEPEEILQAPNYTCNKSVKEEKTRTLDELLKETVIGMDPEDDKPTPKSPMIEVIKQRFELVRTYYQKWEKSTSQEIFKWATEIKGKLSKDQPDTICEAIAIADRVYYLTSKKGYRFRNTQILAMLVFLNEKDKTKGKLCQIRTGEGKTCIVAAIASIRALQGFSVDIITSNMCLARDGVDSSKAFFSVFNLSVSTSEKKTGYTKDILYATISDLQFDFLKDITENLNTRKGRKFQQVILDEVDSMLVDNGGNIAKMSVPFPGMECLRYIYIHIWMALIKAEGIFSEDIKNHLKEIEDKYPNPENRQKEYEKLLNDLVRKERNVLADEIKKSQPTMYPLIPKYLQDYVKRKLDIWIDNAINARYYFNENEQYRIMDLKDGESVIVPVDYENTGITLKNTIWSFGLHQFIQLKHCLRLTFESLTSSFISNIGFIKKYPNEMIFGLTGTLGSRNEQKLLAKVYDVTYAKFPTFKKKELKILEGIIAEDNAWVDQMAQDIKNEKEKRAVLVINETIKDLKLVKEHLMQNGVTCVIKDYKTEDEQGVTGEKLTVGDVILATNIAGRGTDFKTDEKVEKGGGLHVIVGFLPCNQRVEDQACGRTARQGNQGSARLIIRRSEVEELGIENSGVKFDFVRTERDRVEAKRLKTIENELITELNFKDKLFQYFSVFYMRNKEKRRDDEKCDYLMSDLQEHWAFWLDGKDFKAKNIKDKDALKEFQAFEYSDTVQAITNWGVISHNPIYNIQIGKYLEINSMKAMNRFQEAIKMDSNTIIAASANLAIFELKVDNAYVYLKRFIKATGKLFFMNFDTLLDSGRPVQPYLKNAAAIFKTEMDYIINNFYNPEKHNPRNDIFLEIFKTHDRENFFLKHFFSHYYCLKIHYENSIAMSKEDFPNILFEGKQTTSMGFFQDMDREAPKDDKVKFCDLLTNFEINEFHNIGTATLYAIKNLPDVDNAEFTGFRVQIGVALAAFVPVIFCPAAFPLCAAVSGALLVDGIINIVLKILIPSDDKFNIKSFVLRQFQTIGVTIITFGISMAIQSITILKKGIEFCTKLAKMLRESNHLKWICNKLATIVDKIRVILEKRLALAQLRQLQAMQAINKFSSFDLCSDAFKTLAKETLKKVAKSIVKHLIVNVIYAEAVKILKNKKTNDFKKDLNSNEKLKRLFQVNNKETIIAKLEKYNDDFERVQKAKAWIAKCETKVLNRLREEDVIDDNDLKKIMNVIIIVRKIEKCLEVFLELDGTLPFKYLEINLATKGGGSCSVDVAIDEVATRMADTAVTHALELFKVGCSKLYSKLRH